MERPRLLSILWNVLEHYTFSVVRFQVDDEVEDRHRFWAFEMDKLRECRQLVFGEDWTNNFADVF